ncbi:MAG: hypothetical protein HC929_14655 [Leptolyngbyaceae cyanobacterium SM2_5_2]|nr:hypothetical protein [Leptolyngbyaceae cyanobacterium SM2_5_2]
MLVGLASVKIVDGIITELGQSVPTEVRRRAIQDLQVAIQTLRRSERRAIFDGLPASIQPALDGILQTAAIEAMKETLLIALGLCLICLGLSCLLPKRAKSWKHPSNNVSSQQVMAEIRGLKQAVGQFNQTFDHHQKSTQWLVQLAFSLIAAATVTVTVLTVVGKSISLVHWQGRLWSTQQAAGRKSAALPVRLPISIRLNS